MGVGIITTRGACATSHRNETKQTVQIVNQVLYRKDKMDETDVTK